MGSVGGPFWGTFSALLAPWSAQVGPRAPFEPIHLRKISHWILQGGESRKRTFSVRKPRFARIRGGRHEIKKCQNGAKMTNKSIPKSIIFVYASWNRSLGGFLCFWVPKWTQVRTKMGSKMDINFESRNQLNASRLAFSWLSGVEVGSKNRSKIKLKLESKMECILASDFSLLWSIFGIKLGWKMDQKSIKNCIEKPIEKRRAARWLSWASQGPRRPTN